MHLVSPAPLRPDPSVDGHRCRTANDGPGCPSWAILQAAPDAVIVMDLDGLVTWANAKAEQSFGYQPGELQGRHIRTLIAESLADRLAVHPGLSLAQSLANRPAVLERTGRRKDGSTLPLEVTLSAFEGPDGTRIIAAIRDGSLRKAESSRLATLDFRYRALVEAAPDVVVAINLRGEIVLMNLKAERQFGYQRAELIGRPVETIVPGGLADWLLTDQMRGEAEACEHPVEHWRELTGLRKDGTAFAMEVMLSPLGSGDGLLVRAAIRDITVRKQAEAHLLLKLEELKRSNEELEQFACIASHDLQEPLRMVASYTQLLARRYKGRLDSDADDFIAFAVDGARRMQQLIHDVLAFSRVGADHTPLVKVSSAEALQRALRNLRSTLTETGAVVTNGKLPPVLGNLGLLVQVFQNLIGNANKYRGAAAPVIHISAVEHDERTWMFSVADNGLGIEPIYFERIFGMFQRLHKRDEFDGTGIGLAICKKIVERHGGRITVDSAPGAGSTFQFTLRKPAEI